MPLWFLIVLLVIVALAVLLAVGMAFSRRSTDGQRTTIVERR